MTVEYTEDSEYFLNIVKGLEYKENDIKEAQELLYPKLDVQVYDVLISAPNRWADHYLIKDDNNDDKIVCTITLDRNNNLHYFVTKDLTTANALSFVKTIKTLADKVLECRKVLFVTTANWYEEAIKFNKLIGFKILKSSNGKGFTTWYYAKTEGH